jgi:hypothetical protein
MLQEPKLTTDDTHETTAIPGTSFTIATPLDRRRRTCPSSPLSLTDDHR